MFSNGSINALAVLSHKGRKSGSAIFPCGADARNLRRIRDDESIHSWFTRCIDIGLKGRDVDGCILEEHIGLFAEVQFGINGLIYANCQAIACIEGTLNDFYSEPASAEVRYHRLDLDLNCPGPMFKEDHPHIHSVPSGAPRFLFHASASHNVIVDFVEFLYLNYSYDQWLDWAKKTWNEAVLRDPIEDKFPAIQDGYNKGWIAKRLGEYGGTISELRATLAAKKQSMYGTLLPQPEVDSLNYNVP
jgi:hypothetical protein